MAEAISQPPSDDQIRLGHLYKYAELYNEPPILSLELESLAAANYERIGALAVVAADVNDKTRQALLDMHTQSPLPALLVAGENTNIFGPLDVTGLLKGSLVNSRIFSDVDKFVAPCIFRGIVSVTDCNLGIVHLTDTTVINSRIVKSKLVDCRAKGSTIIDSELQKTDVTDAHLDRVHGSAGQNISGQITRANLAHTRNGQVIVTPRIYS